MATDEEISVVEGYGGDADEDLAGARCGLGDFLDLDAVTDDHVSLGTLSTVSFELRSRGNGSVAELMRLTDSRLLQACPQLASK